MFDGRRGGSDHGTQMITIKATRRTFIITLLGLAVLSGVSATVLFYPSSFYSFTCGQFDIPEYEKAYGFTFSEVPVMRPDGSTRMDGGISAVDPQGAFARSGVRAGDIPRMHHGLSDFCGDIAYAEEGGKLPLEVFNVYDDRAGKEPRRELVLLLK